MSPLIRRSMLHCLLVGVCCSRFISSAAAQHPLAPMPHPVPVTRGPAPVMHPPVFTAPINRIGPTAVPPPFIPRFPNNFYSGTVVTAAFRPFQPIRNPRSPIIVIYRPSFFFDSSLWALNHCWWTTCDLYLPWTINYTSVSSPGPITYLPEVYETPVYVYGPERPDLPQLYLKDGTILNVTDYWVVDGELHFTMTGEDGKSVERLIPFDALDLQTTVNANTQRGFRFMLRDEPFEQYLRDHPEGPPKQLTPEHH